MNLAEAYRAANGRAPRRDIVLPVRAPTNAQEKGLAAVIRPVVQHWQKAGPQIIDQARARNYLADSADDADSAISEAEAQSQVLIAAALVGLTAWVASLDRWQRNKWAGVILTRTGLDLGQALPFVQDREAVRASVAWATSLIRDVNQQLRNRVQSAVMASISLRENKEQLTRRLSEVFAKARRRADLIARDQAHKIAAKMLETRHRDAGLTEYVWLHSFLPNPRRHHVERQGQRFKWNRPPRDGHPGHAPHCRCTAAAVLPKG
jgi:SPP1 gp7 family putative phage head morphogenesis protein